jgi:hypothetical protein
METGVRSESHDSAVNGRSGVSPSAEQLDDLLVQRPPLKSVTFADVDSHQHSLTLEPFHLDLQSALQTGARPKHFSRYDRTGETGGE